jgi:uncharacterized protein (TIGR00369 family)
MMALAPTDTYFAARVRDSFARQPAMAHIGARLVAVEAGRVEIELAHDPRLTQQHGFIHGGIVGLLIDNACGYAAFSLFPADAAPLSVEYKVNLVAPADGERLVARASVLRSGRTLTVCSCEVTATKSGRATLCAFGTATIMALAGRPDTKRPDTKHRAS